MAGPDRNAVRIRSSPLASAPVISRLSRRGFVRAAAGAGLTAAGLALLGACGTRRGPDGPSAGDAPPETTTIRLMLTPSVCMAPQYVADTLLRDEGFSRVDWIESVGGVAGARAMAAGQIDLSMNFAAPTIIPLDAGDPLVVLAGVHVGCFELFGNEQVRAIRDLKGKTIATLGPESAQYLFLASMLAYVGLDPRQDVRWVEYPPTEASRLLSDGTIDAFLGFPPSPQELRAKGIGHVVFNSGADRPWSQYYCCMISANREFVGQHPAATRRALRAILKGDQLCAETPERGAQAFLGRGFPTPYDYTLQAVKDIPYGRWRDYDPEDTLRFYALRLHEVGMLKSNPNAIVERGTDWRFLNDLKRELKG
jgi:NitT/TauT family transport system substrate-binding protein